MALKGLVNNQTIIIDDHKRGNKEIKDWDNEEADIHIDKTTNFPINGIKQKVRIRIPINSKREIKIENGKRKAINDVPRQLQKEIESAFRDKQTRESFIAEVLNILKDYDTILDDKSRVKQIVENLAKHFRLGWKEEEIETYSNDVLQVYTQTYRDSQDKQFFITIDREKIRIAENNGYARHQRNIKY